MQEEETWQVVNGNHLFRVYKFEDFKKALEFANILGLISETQNHHPDITISYGLVKVNLWTHKTGKITEEDNRLAKKFEQAYEDFN